MRMRRVFSHDGGSLRARLVVLILVPLLGVMVGAAVSVGARVQGWRTAQQSEQYIRAAAAVDAARAAFQQEVLPAFTATAAKDPAVFTDRAGLVPASTVKVAAKIINTLGPLRQNTSDALEALKKFPTVADAANLFETRLVGIRALLDNADSVATALDPITSFQSGMAAVEVGQVAAATKAGISAEAVQALHDADLTMRATQAAAQQFTLFVATQFSLRSNPKQLQISWAAAWGTFAAASYAVEQQSVPEVAQQWRDVAQQQRFRGFANFLRAQLSPTGTVSIGAVTRLIGVDGERNIAYKAVLDFALARALDAGRSQSQNAITELEMIVAAALALLLASLVVVVLVLRSITNPLSQLADEANRVSRGDLVDVHVGGPGEVRTVARALSTSVASLRNIEAQATAVAAGDLDNPVLRNPLPGPLGQVVHSSVASIINAINDREVARREVAFRAAHDALTELPNRSQAMALIAASLSRAVRNRTSTALMFIDLDHFKAVNDTFGHAAGDEVLQTVARRMRALVRDGDSVARLGGDEFVVLVESVEDEAAVVALAERIVDQVSSEVMAETRALRIGASIGVAFCRSGEADADQLLQEADAAAYRAKNSGRGRVDVFDDHLRGQLRSRADLEQAIAQALECGEFALHYQPVIDLASGRIRGVEALIRWMRPGHGMVPPDKFIPEAERSNLINDIGRWVLREATTQLAEWDEAEPASKLTMAVNISGRHLTSTRVVRDVQEALTASGIDSDRLHIEVTETVLVDDPNASGTMQALRDLGCLVSIDDFGTGFTSIGQLPKLPVDTLKIDRSFVDSDDPKIGELVRLIVAAAHAFGLAVVAEGIETQHQADRLRLGEVEWGQGYLFARPLPPAELLATLRTPDNVLAGADPLALMG